VQEVYFGSGKHLRAQGRAMTAPLLQLDGLSAWYGAAHILFDVALEVGVGEVVALMGRNGAGKSTTLKAAMGMVEQRSGTVRSWGQDISRWPPHAIARAGLGYVPEDRRIFTDLTVLENLEVGRQPPRPGDGSPGHRSACSSCSPTWARCPTAPAAA
jgi:branched-chain amino acid transport system ATP-binding protein